MKSSEQVRFYFDGSLVIVYNSTNAHIFSEEDMFTDKIDPIVSNGVATIAVKDIITKDIGTVNWYWTYDEVQLHRMKLNNVLYFTDSPANILSATALDEYMKNYEGTWVP